MKDALELFGMLCLSALAIIAGILGFAAVLFVFAGFLGGPIWLAMILWGLS
jgi:hypothetical protein